jgi:hypothetical protein
MLQGLIFRFTIVNKLIHLAQLPIMQGDQDMSDTINDPQPIDPPTNTGGGGTTTTTEEEESGTVEAIDPPTNTGGGSNA